MRKGRHTVLYDVYFPIWVQFLVPRVLISVLIVNFIVNGAVVKATLHVMSVKHTFRDLYGYAGWATALGLAADFAGLFVYDLLLRGQYTITTALNPLLLSIIAVAAPLIFAANFMLARQLLRLPGKQSLLLAAVMAIVTSPWLVFLDRSHLV